MSHFYGTLQGSRGQATRCGSKDSGITTYAASWAGAVQACVYVRDGKDWATVRLTTWSGAGVDRLLYDGPVDPVRVVVGNGRPDAPQLLGLHLPEKTAERELGGDLAESSAAV